MSGVHAAIGFGIVGGFFVLFLWGSAAVLLKRDPTEWFWRLLAVLQATLLLQLVAGAIVWAGGGRPPILHYLYGSIFPVIALTVAHVLGRTMEDPGDAPKVFAAASFVVFGLTLRALTTGLGIG